MEETQISGTAPPFKKRRFHRKRTGYAVEEMPDKARTTESPSSPPPTELLNLDETMSRNSNIAGTQSQEQRDAPLSVAELLRQRKALQRRKGGIGFSNASTTTDIALPAPQDESPIHEEGPIQTKFTTVTDRFAPQTGQVAEVDQHMYGIHPHSEKQLARCTF